MFEDSLVESTGRIRTRSPRYAAGSFLLQAALVSVVVLLPYLYPAALPPKFLSVPLIAPPPAPAPQMAAQRASAPVSRPVLSLDLIAPPRIPAGIYQFIDPAPPGKIVGSGVAPGTGDGPPGALLGGIVPPPAPLVRLARPDGPVHVSSGVAAGQLVAPIQPVYPIIAKEAGIQGTVIVAATISTEGRIENLHVVSGPAMLVNAAVTAIREARYRPYLLNGQPVEVETTISVVFLLNGNG
ncbi:MAG TPA: energy transducer TonB [Acidobacteriaceae bacterium]|jgi:protein TonB|nr:energy transducer TonB [Acidobacteriaceae bacterium]